MIARSRRPTTCESSILASNCLACRTVISGVLPSSTCRRSPRTQAAGLSTTTCRKHHLVEHMPQCRQMQLLAGRTHWQSIQIARHMGRSNANKLDALAFAPSEESLDSASIRPSGADVAKFPVEEFFPSELGSLPGGVDQRRTDLSPALRLAHCSADGLGNQTSARWFSPWV